MKAVILVGGLGTRLRPLTCNTPKPMIPLVNQPFIEWMLERLRDQGIGEIVLAVQYLADRFRSTLGDGSRFGVTLHIVEEPEPRGTAGAVKNVEHLLDDTTFVFNGDVMTDLDLEAMLAFHREKRSKLTLSLTPVDDPTQFGLVETDAHGRIQRFLEKPSPEDITTNMVNAGTYLIEPELIQRVPPNQHAMFERGLFPDTLASGDRMFGYASQAYWTDIGKPQTYIDVHHDILMGKVRYNFRGNQIADRVWAGDDSDIHHEAQLIGPVVLGAGVRVERGARIVGPSVLGDNCVIGAEALVEASVLWGDNQIEAKAVVRASVLGRGNWVGTGTQISGGAIVGDACVIGPDNRLERGIRLWPGTTLNERSITF